MLGPSLGMKKNGVTLGKGSHNLLKRWCYFSKKLKATISSVADHDMVIVGVVEPGVCGWVPGSVLLYGGGGGDWEGLGARVLRQIKLW